MPLVLDTGSPSWTKFYALF